MARSFTRADLGLHGDVLRAATGQPFAFFSADGSRFAAVQLAALPGRTSSVNLMANAGGFTLIADSSSAIIDGSAGKSQVTSQQPTVLHSTDGRTWTALSPLPADFSSSSIGNLSGHTVVLGNTSTGPAVATLGANGRWVVATMDAVLEPALNKNAASSLAMADIGPAGAAAVVMSTPDPVAGAGGMDFTSGPYKLHVLNTKLAAVATGANGAEVASTDGFRITAIGLPATQATGLRFNPSNRTVTLLDPKMGTPLAVFDINAANQPRVSVRTTPGRPVQPGRCHLVGTVPRPADGRCQPHRQHRRRHRVPCSRERRNQPEDGWRHVTHGRPGRHARLTPLRFGRSRSGAGGASSGRVGSDSDRSSDVHSLFI